MISYFFLILSLTTCYVTSITVTQFGSSGTCSGTGTKNIRELKPNVCIGDSSTGLSLFFTCTASTGAVRIDLYTDTNCKTALRGPIPSPWIGKGDGKTCMRIDADISMLVDCHFPSLAPTTPTTTTSPPFIPTTPSSTSASGTESGSGNDNGNNNNNSTTPVPTRSTLNGNGTTNMASHTTTGIVNAVIILTAILAINKYII